MAEYSAHLIQECLRRNQFRIIMVVNKSDIPAFMSYHNKIGINSNVEYISFEDLNYLKWKNFDALLSYHQNAPGKLIRDIRSNTNIPRIVMTHTLTDKNTMFPIDPSENPMGHFNAYFATGPAAFKGSWEEYIKIHPSIPKTVKIFKIGRPRTDVLLSNKYDKIKILTDLNLDPYKKTVLYSPTFQKEASLEQCGLDIINIVKSMDLNLLIRVHHMSLTLDDQGANERGHSGKDWRKILNKIDSENANVRFVEGDSNRYFVSSDLLIGDVSGSCYEFLLQNKPVVFIDSPKFFAEHGTGGISYWGRESGDIVSDLSNLANVVYSNLYNPTNKEVERKALISKLVYNPGHAAEIAVDTIIGLINGQLSYPKWRCRLNRYRMLVQKLPYRINDKVTQVYHSLRKRVFLTDTTNKNLSKE